MRDAGFLILNAGYWIRVGGTGKGQRAERIADKLKEKDQRSKVNGAE
jgi:hypothetical protein